ncbi:MAG: hypothetical protein MUO76_16980 [Anaerolineaceae bacterium]|nr:hypothetical protein [Anaerolineaceae bacterium]
MKELIFAFLFTSSVNELDAPMLANSIRTFAGRFSKHPIWVLIPENEEILATDVEEMLLSLNVQLIPFEIEDTALEFPFAGKVFASARAEALAEEKASFLVWMDADSIVINEPNELLLDDETRLGGYRPVDHTLIGSRFDLPLDPFWTLIYEYCGVHQDAPFPMTTSVDRLVLRPYFNAGMSVVRPAHGLLQSWRDNFARLYRQPFFERFYNEDLLYKVFIHQAVLAGTILSTLKQEELQEFPHTVNYPLHMHSQHSLTRRVKRLNDVVICRHDTFFNDPDWRERIHIDEPLKSWLEAQARVQVRK